MLVGLFCYNLSSALFIHKNAELENVAAEASGDVGFGPKSKTIFSDDGYTSKQSHNSGINVFNILLLTGTWN